MASILSRLYRIARSAMPHPWEESSRRPGDKKGPNAESFDDGGKSGPEGADSHYDQRKASGGPSTGEPWGIPSQVAEDLAVFNLVPPSSLEEVRKARNREVKKYHSDRFLNDPERFETSKKIMQIYNAAYDRLKGYYQKKTP